MVQLQKSATDSDSRHARGEYTVGNARLPTAWLGLSGSYSATVGMMVGCWLGSCVGRFEGAEVESVAGLWLGNCVGSFEGAAVESVGGCWLGSCVGRFEGKTVGLKVGNFEGGPPSRCSPLPQTN